MSDQYLFTSARLGFKPWQDSDIPAMAAINADPIVREFFPGIQNYEETATFVRRMQQLMADKGYCYFAIDKLGTNTFIGFIGIADQTFESSFTPCTDIGWRLARAEWNNGFATEGAMSCLQYAFNNLQFSTINAIAPAINKRSIRVMEKIGMHKVQEFAHPLLANNERLRNCVLYEIDAEK